MAAVSDAFTTTTLMAVTAISVFTMDLIQTMAAWLGGADLAGHANRADRATLRCRAAMHLMVVAEVVAVGAAGDGDGCGPSVSRKTADPGRGLSPW